MIDRLLKPDGKSLTSIVWGKAGSGKSCAIEYWSKLALNSKTFDDAWRLIYISPKHEGFQNLKQGDKQINPVYDVEDAIKAIRKNRLIVWYPNNMKTIELEVDYLIASLFQYKQKNEDFNATIIFDDAQTFIESRKTNSSEMKRLILTGRSKRIKTVLVAHGLVINKMLEGQVDVIVGFDSGNPIWWRAGLERFNLDIEKYHEKLLEKPYSFLWYDMRKTNPQLFEPLDIS